MIRSLRLRLAIGASIAIGLVLLVVWLSLSRIFTDYVVGRYRAEMATLVDTIAAQVAVRNGEIVLPREPADPRLSLPAGGRYWQITRDGGTPSRQATARSMRRSGLGRQSPNMRMSSMERMSSNSRSAPSAPSTRRA